VSLHPEPRIFCDRRVRHLQKKSENLSLTFEAKNGVMLNSFQHPGFFLVGEILNQVQDDRSKKFQIDLGRITGIR
jgi:hypothetical protein